MPKYIALIGWTDQGIKSYADTINRADAAGQLGGKFGVTLEQTYWTLGPYDVVGILDAPDDESATAFALALSSQGNVRTTTMRAFDAAQMREIVSRAGG